MKQKKSFIKIILGLLAALLLWFLKEKGYLPQDSGTSGDSASRGEIARGETSLESLTLPKTNGAGLELLQNCQLITGRNGDGDSFHIRHSKGENEFRLYFVDTPESEFKTYRGGEDNGERIAEQGSYFGGLSQKETTNVGKAGKKFILELLGKEGFKVLTKWENVYDPSRQYAFVIVTWEGREVYLHELLVAKGLARIHTRGSDLPQGRNWRAQKDFLKTLENAAKAKKLGAWGL